jgi:hypothetical protein
LWKDGPAARGKSEIRGPARTESTGLTVEAVDWASACIILKQHKTAHNGKSRTICLPAEAVAVLKAQ